MRSWWSKEIASISTHFTTFVMLNKLFFNSKVLVLVSSLINTFQTPVNISENQNTLKIGKTGVLKSPMGNTSRQLHWFISYNIP
ncbi:hypothetical protein RIF29_13512 [Crotalaria pallida]|uniref:Uncharacterized protein n=1 Tax=Crotalaria pallida TaxID=3830 RepID=A0AAN9IPI0_CROPI